MRNDFTPGTTVKLAGEKPVDFFSTPTVPTSESLWLSPAGTFTQSAVGTVLEVSDVLDGTYLKVFVGTSVGWIRSDYLTAV